MYADVKKCSRKSAGWRSRPHEKGETPRELARHIMCVVSFALAAAEAQPSITWTPLREPGSGGRLTSMAVSPHDSMHVLLGGDMLGIGVSFDRGDSWQATFGLLNWEIADFTFHPSKSNVVWAATMGGPYISRDRGVTWECRRTVCPTWPTTTIRNPFRRSSSIRQTSSVSLPSAALIGISTKTTPTRSSAPCGKAPTAVKAGSISPRWVVSGSTVGIS